MKKQTKELFLKAMHIIVKGILILNDKDTKGNIALLY